jgi:ubiquinone/menaquinone biosynthesis C-methylase UbiE
MTNQTKQIKNYWDKRAGEYASKRAKINDDIYLELVKLSKKDLVLDAGCGPGIFAKNIASKTNAQFICIDNSDKMLGLTNENLKNIPHAFVIKSDLNDRIFPDNTFHAIFCLLTIHHLTPNKQKRLIKEFHRILKPKGALIITEIWAFKRDDKISQIAYKMRKRLEKLEGVKEYHQPYSIYLKSLKKAGFKKIRLIKKDNPLDLDRFTKPKDKILTRFVKKLLTLNANPKTKTTIIKSIK